MQNIDYTDAPDNKQPLNGLAEGYTKYLTLVFLNSLVLYKSL